jgi:2-polyprenyl-3-methyl-5-hydroxy-6-metoxy-1,4-benzoquinol methylase
MKMNPDEDAFGKIIYSHYKGEESSHCIERDDGYIDVWESGAVYFREFNDWSESEKEAMYYVEGKILDIGCGAGRHSLYLQKNNHEILAIDNSPDAIKTSKLRGLKNAKVMSLHDINPDLGVFDTILMMGNNFGLCGNPHNAKRLLKIFYAITSENGTIIAATANPYNTDLEEHLNYHQLNRTRGRLGGQLIIRIRIKKIKSPWMELLLVSPEELEEILKDTGWKIKNILNDKDDNFHYIAILGKVTNG